MIDVNGFEPEMIMSIDWLSYITKPQHLVCRVVQSLHTNHMQMSIIEVSICKRASAYDCYADTEPLRMLNAVYIRVCIVMYVLYLLHGCTLSVLSDVLVATAVRCVCLRCTFERPYIMRCVRYSYMSFAHRDPVGNNYSIPLAMSWSTCFKKTL